MTGYRYFDNWFRGFLKIPLFSNLGQSLLKWPWRPYFQLTLDSFDEKIKIFHCARKSLSFLVSVILLDAMTPSLLGYLRIWRNRRWFLDACLAVSISRARAKLSNDSCGFPSLKAFCMSIPRIPLINYFSKSVRGNLSELLDRQGGRIELSLLFILQLYLVYLIQMLDSISHFKTFNRSCVDCYSNCEIVWRISRASRWKAKITFSVSVHHPNTAAASICFRLSKTANCSCSPLSCYLYFLMFYEIFCFYLSCFN